MLGAAMGGIALGSLGDRVGRTRAMGISILLLLALCRSGRPVQTQEQMLVLRFLVGLGVGGMWPNGVALVSECWPDASRPVVAGIMGAGLNAGILLLSQLARLWPITPDSWRWIFSWRRCPRCWESWCSRAAGIPPMAGHTWPSTDCARSPAFFHRRGRDPG